MAHTLQLNRRLLLSILRAPPIFTQHGQINPRTSPIRSVSSSCRHLSNNFSVSFGAETDQLLASLDGTPDQSSTTRPKRKVKGTSKKSTKKEKGSTDQEAVSQRGIEGDVAPDSTGVSKTSVQSTRSRPSIAEDDDIYGEPVILDLSEDSSAFKPRKSTLPSDSVQSNLTQRQRNKPPSSSRNPEPQPATTKSAPSPNAEPWQIQKHALKQKFGGTAWSPRKKISVDAMEGIRTLHTQDPQKFTTETLANQFKVSPEAIRRILKSKWRPSAELLDERRARWARRHDRIWDQQAALGLRPARRKDREIEGPERFDEEMKAKVMLGEI